MLFGTIVGVLVGVATALPDGLARTPIMGVRAYAHVMSGWRWIGVGGVGREI